MRPRNKQPQAQRVSPYASRAQPEGAGIRTSSVAIWLTCRERKLVGTYTSAQQQPQGFPDWPKSV